MVPGHEFAGEIAAIGPEVAGLLVGERVAIDPALWCGACRFCKEGKHHLCSNRGAIGGTADGGFAEYVVVPYQNAYVVPDAMTFPQAALAEPLSCVVHGVDILQPRLGESCLVVGAGTTGLLFVQLLLRAGAAAVDVVNRTASRLERAKKLGARRVGASVSEMRENSPAGYDCVVDATGIPELVEAAFDTVAPGGKLLVFGVSPAAATVRLPPYRITAMRSPWSDPWASISGTARRYVFWPKARWIRSSCLRMHSTLRISLVPSRSCGAGRASRYR